MSFFSFLFILILLNGNLSAHPGASDKNGCHVNSDTGHRHCHKIKKTKTTKKKAKKKKRKQASVD